MSTFQFGMRHKLHSTFRAAVPQSQFYDSWHLLSKTCLVQESEKRVKEQAPARGITGESEDGASYCQHYMCTGSECCSKADGQAGSKGDHRNGGLLLTTLAFLG